MMWAIDDALFRFLYSPGHGVVVALAAFFSLLGEGWNYCALALFLVPKPTRRFAWWLGVALAITGLVVAILKRIVARGRPLTSYPLLRRALLDSPTDYSFPSGHAAGSFCVALFCVRVLSVRRPRAVSSLAGASSALGLASCIAVSRVVLGFHFPSDVVAGAVLGAFIGSTMGRRFASPPSFGSPAPPSDAIAPVAERRR